MHMQEKPVEEKQICEHCQRTYPTGEVCPCLQEERRRQKNRLLWEKRTHRAKTYRLRPPASGQASLGDASFHPVIARVLARRGIVDAETFVKAPVSELISRPMLHQTEAVMRINQAIEKQEKITLYGDYDVDGVTSVALGLNVLGYLGAQVDYYINDRFSEGFGIHPRAVETIQARGTSLIITADNGISGLVAAGRAQELGLDLIVTDHHEPNPEGLPQAIVVDHKQAGCDYPNKELVGVGVLFKVLDELCGLRKANRRAMHELDLVALGTVADVAELTGENRCLVKNGLKLMNPSQLGPKKKVRVGIRALREVTGMKDTDEVGAYHLGFIFGPMINAEGRLEGRPHRAVELLSTSDEKRARQLAQELKQTNDQRKKLVEDLYEKAKEKIDLEKPIFVIEDASFAEGVVGLLAGKLVEEFYTPAIVLTTDQKGRFKGSGRSVPGLNLKACLDKLAGLLEQYGGHAQACGLCLEKDRFQVVKNMLETEVQRCSSQIKPECVLVDEVIQEEDLTDELFYDMERLAPFGVGFPRPRLMLQDFKVASLNHSRDKRHTRVRGATQADVDFWAFGKTIEDQEELSCLVGTTSVHEFRGKTQLQFRIESHGRDLTLERSSHDCS